MNEKDVACEKKTENGFERSLAKQVLLGMITNFSSIGPSMSLGFSAVALPILTSATNPYALSSDEASWFASIASLATPFGCIFSGPISDRYGRKIALFTVNIICFIGWLLIATAYYLPEHQYIIMLLGRLLTGLSTGLSSNTASIYMAEVSAPKLRGVFCTWNTVSFAIGVLIVYFLGFIIKDNWGLISLITAVIPIIGMFFIVFVLPESPTWLVRKNRVDEAKINMCKIYGTKLYIPEVQREIDTLVENQGTKTTTTRRKSIPEQIVKKIRYLIEPTSLKPLLLLVVFFFFQQFAGTFVIVFYAIDIVKEAGITMDANLTIVLIGLIRLVAAMLVSYISKFFGRRPLSMISGSGMTICMISLTGYILAINYSKITEETQQSLLFLPLLLILAYFFTSTLGFLPIPFAMAAEVFPAKIRGTASGLASGIGYFFNFVTVKIYPNMIEGMGRQGVFLFYGAIALAGTIFVAGFLPETKEKTLSEIEAHFGKTRVKKNSLLEKEVCET